MSRAAPTLRRLIALAGSLAVLAVPSAGQDTPLSGAELELSRRLLEEHARKPRDPSHQPLTLAGREQAGNDLRSRTPALALSVTPERRIDPEEAHRRALALYEDGARHHAPPPSARPAAASERTPGRAIRPASEGDADPDRPLSRPWWQVAFPGAAWHLPPKNAPRLVSGGNPTRSSEEGAWLRTAPIVTGRRHRGSATMSRRSGDHPAVRRFRPVLLALLILGCRSVVPPVDLQSQVNALRAGDGTVVLDVGTEDLVEVGNTFDVYRGATYGARRAPRGTPLPRPHHELEEPDARRRRGHDAPLNQRP